LPTLTKNLFHGHGEGEFELAVTGRWPDDAGGYVFNIGPDRSEPGGHWFNGQGLLCRIHCEALASGRIRVDFRRVETPLAQIRDRLPRLLRRQGIQKTSPPSIRSTTSRLRATTS
jgi:carotenoid cleavage dioxygenase-like enzyme